MSVETASERSGDGRAASAGRGAPKKGGVPWWPFLAVAMVLGAGTCRYKYRPYKIPSGAMQPSLNVGDHILVSTSTDAPRRGEVIVFAFPENTAQDFVKRAIALPGDKLTVLDGRPIINGWMTPRCHVGRVSREGYAHELYIEHYGERSYGTFHESKLDERQCKSNEDCAPGVCAAGTCGEVLQGPFEVAAGEVWVMGDNRNNTFDSRAWRQGRGAGVPFGLIIGPARVVLASGHPDTEGRTGLDAQGPPRLLRGEGLSAEIERCVKGRPEATVPPR